MAHGNSHLKGWYTSNGHDAGIPIFKWRSHLYDHFWYLNVNYVMANYVDTIPDSKVHGANMGPTWVLSAPGEPHGGLMKLAIWDGCWFPGVLCHQVISFNPSMDK